MRPDFLTRAVRVSAFIFFTGMVLHYAQGFLVPLIIAALFAMLLLPMSTALQRRGLGRGLAVSLAVVTLLLSAAVIVGVLAWQVGDLTSDLQGMEQNISRKVAEVQEFLARKLGISAQKQQALLEQQKQASSGSLGRFVSGALASAGAALTQVVLVLVYVFLFLYFRSHLKNFVFRLVKKGDEAKAREVMESGRQVAQKYLSGMALMIVSLWVMYSIGFSLVGIKSPVLFAILCGLLEIIPFVGNLTGNLLTIGATLAQGGSTGQVVGILVTYGTVQFLQSYFLEPLVVGKGVNIHPMFTIIGIVAGEAVWGIGGMVLAIPVMGVVKIVCDHVPALQPYGYLLGEERSGAKGWLGKLKKGLERRRE